MGKLENFNIALQKEIPSYSFGETLEGVVKFIMTERTKIRSLKCTIIGKSKFE
jgi:hypothetical protein